MTKTYTPTKTPIDAGLFRDAHYDASIPGPNKTALPVSGTFSNPATPNATVQANAPFQLTQIANLVANNNAWQNAYGGNVIQSPTPTATFTGAQLTATATFTPWNGNTNQQTIASQTPTPINTPVANNATWLILDFQNNSGTVGDFGQITNNSVVVDSQYLAPAGGSCNSVVYPDNNGNAKWGFIPPSQATTLNRGYRLWVAPIGTPPPVPLH